MTKGKENYIVAIDPGTRESAYCILGSGLKPLYFNKAENEAAWQEIVNAVNAIKAERPDATFLPAVEMVASYGMPVGVEVFETVRWIGRYDERLEHLLNTDVEDIYRQDEKLQICHSTKANDATIKQALVDMFAPNVPNYGKGTKNDPGWFYGFKADIWSAYAVGITYYLKMREKGLIV